MFLRLFFFTVISLNLHETSGFLFGLLGSSESEEACEHGKLITRSEINQYFYCNHGDLELIGCLFPLGEFNQSPEYERRIPVGNTVDNKGPNLNDKSITFIRYRCTREGKFLPIGCILPGPDESESESPTYTMFSMNEKIDLSTGETAWCTVYGFIVLKAAKPSQ